MISAMYAPITAQDKATDWANYADLREAQDAAARAEKTACFKKSEGLLRDKDGRVWIPTGNKALKT